MLIRKRHVISFILGSAIVLTISNSAYFFVRFRRYAIKAQFGILGSHRQFGIGISRHDAMRKRNTYNGSFPIESFPKLKCNDGGLRFAMVTVCYGIVSAGKYMDSEVYNALQSVRCYAKMRGYDLYQIQYENGKYLKGLNDSTIISKCKSRSPMVSRHCIIAHLLVRYDYIIHLDADSGVINPNHCFEEYITPGIDVFLLERVHSGEIQAGHYIVKNTTYARDFLLKWYEMTKVDVNTDNIILMKNMFPSLVLKRDQHEECLKLKNYFVYVRCIKKFMNGTRVFPPVQVYRRAQAFVRDGWVTKFNWSEKDFLLHAMKRQDDVMFTRKLNETDCASGTWTLPIKKELFADVTKMKVIWRNVDINSTKNRLAIGKPDISNCWPDCPANILT